MLRSSYSALPPQGDALKTLQEGMELTRQKVLDLSTPFLPYVPVLTARNLLLTLY